MQENGGAGENNGVQGKKRSIGKGVMSLRYGTLTNPKQLKTQGHSPHIKTKMIDLMMSLFSLFCEVTRVSLEEKKNPKVLFNSRQVLSKCPSHPQPPSCLLTPSRHYLLLLLLLFL